MLKRSLVWHLIPSYALLVVGAALAFGWTALNVLEQSLIAAKRAELEAQAEFIDSELGPDLSSDSATIARLARRIDQASETRVTILRPDGSVEHDSRGRPAEITGQATRPEIQRALAAQPGNAVRYNAGQDQNLLYLAVPVLRHDQVFGVIYLTSSLAARDRAVADWQVWVIGLSLGLLALCAPLAAWPARAMARWLSQIAAAANRLGQGQWSARAPVADPRELAELSEAFNHLADDLQTRIGVLLQHNNEQQAVLASMAEGVLAVDSQEQIISMNTASVRLLGLDQSQVQGRRLQEVVRNADLSRFVSRSLASSEPITADVLVHGDRQRVMQAHGSALHNSESRAIGAVIVLNDVTDFRKLEHIRRDFVANVSHELKTPVTSIKGFVETLLDGAVKDPVDAERFLRIVAKQADRLHAIIEDLLALSKIEQAEDTADIVLETTSLSSVIEAAVGTCQSAAQDRAISVEVECPQGLTANVNPLLFEQALVNLLDNAIKYSEPRSRVGIAATASDAEVTISVVDRGPGIAEEHLSRIFERFYRVDRARSRKLGGTGLGLAIVKHIVQAHHGRVSVDSALGIGSTFSIHLPR